MSRINRSIMDDSAALGAIKAEIEKGRAFYFLSAYLVEGRVKTATITSMEDDMLEHFLTTELKGIHEDGEATSD